MDLIKHAPLRINDIRSKYKVIDKVGKGTYGTVFKVLNKQDNKYYAIKKFQNTEAKLQVEGFPITALRQISLLKHLNHPNIVNLKQIICSKPNKRNLYRGSTFMVFEYMHHDFAGLFRSKIKFTVAETKSIMKQLIEGCGFLHQNKVMHRDIKSANILMNDQGIVQLADFGLGRRTRFESMYTYKVVTLWYRAPELLLGCKSYNHKVDVWSIGCVFAELLTGDVLFKKQTEYAIIEKIYEICGDLDENEYTEEYLRGCVYYNDMKHKKPHKNTLASFIRKICPNIDSVAIEFLQGLLELNPYKRLSCNQALQHEYFKTQPRACEPEQIQKLDVEYHEMFKDRSLKIERKERKASLNWSEEEERKKTKQEHKQQKSLKHDDRYLRQYPKNDRDRYLEKDGQRPRNLTYHQNKQESSKPDYPKREHPGSNKKYEVPRPRRKYSKSPSRSHSYSSSSSSSSRSRPSKTRDNKKSRYENLGQRKPQRKESQHYQKKKVDITISRKENGNHSYPEKDRDIYRESEKGKPYSYQSKWNQKDKRNESYKKDSVSYKEERSYKEKTFEKDRKSSDRREIDRKQSEYDDRKHETSRERSRYPYSKDNYQKSYSKYSPPRDKYKDQNKSKTYTKQKYQPGQYRSKDDYQKYEKDQPDRYSKPYTSRDTKQYYRKYQTPSQKYHQDRKIYRSPHRQREYRNDRNDRDRDYRKDRQYRDYEKSSYDYQKKQPRIRDDSRYKEESRTYKKVSIQRQRSIDRKKHSPRKNMDSESYYQR